MAEFRDVGHQIGLAPTIKLLPWVDGTQRAVADFDAETAAFTLELSGVDSNVQQDEFSQKDQNGLEYFWTGNSTASFTGSVLEKTPEIVLLLTGRDPADLGAAVAGFVYGDVDGIQTRKYWSALIIGDFGGGDFFGYVAEKCHFMAEGMPSIKLDSAPASFTIKVDAVDGRASLRAFSGPGV